MISVPVGKPNASDMSEIAVSLLVPVDHLGNHGGQGVTTPTSVRF